MEELAKRSWAEELAAIEAIAWVSDDTTDDNLYGALEALGYTWDSIHWRPEGYVTPVHAVRARPQPTDV